MPAPGPGLLAAIDGPADLRRLGPRELAELAGEIRRLIVATVARTGGHLASNLGSVELTLALHRVFETPRDRIVWDVGHQTYAHKIVTGRRESFASLRQSGGLAGFPKRCESPFDVCDTGHGGTSISTALGLAEARDYLGQEFEVIAVIGDGAMTSGLAFEGLDCAGSSRRTLRVVLNDNEMSISPNVGALAAYISNRMLSPWQRRAREAVKYVLEHVPRLGPRMVTAVQRLEELAKGMLVPGLLFEELGFRYLGPIDGHDLAGLIETFRTARTLEGPTLIHVVTRKGKGYVPAELDPTGFHGASPFKIESGEPRDPACATTFTDVFGAAALEIAERDARLVAITAAMTDGTGLAAFARRFPERFYDVGIAEQHAVTFASGLALMGLRPLVAIYSTFLQRAFDQIIHDVCLQNLPVTFALDRAGLVGADGETHQGMFDLSYLRLIPNLIIMAPRDGPELRRMLWTAIQSDRPAAVRYPRGSGAGCAPSGELVTLPIGRGELVHAPEGGQAELLLVGLGSTVAACCEAAVALAAAGRRPAVFDARFVKPLDEAALLALAPPGGPVLVVEENVLAGGFGSAVLEALARHGHRGPVRCLGLPDEFIPHGTQAELRRRYGLDGRSVLRAAEELLGGGGDGGRGRTPPAGRVG